MAERWKYILEFGEQRFGLEGQPASIGRSRKCEIAVADPSVSRRHAVLTAQEGMIHLEDLGSSNGTFVNGERVQGSVHLRNGDILALGDAEIRVYVIAASGVETVRMPAGGVPPELADELPVGEATSFLQEASVKLARDALGESGDESMPSVPVRNHMAPPPPPAAPSSAAPPSPTVPPPAAAAPATVEMPAAAPSAPQLDPANPLQTAQFDPSMLQDMQGGAAPESPLQTMHIDTGDLPKVPPEGAAEPRDLLQTARFDPASLPPAAPSDPHQTDPHQTARFDPSMLPTGQEGVPQAPPPNPVPAPAAEPVAAPVDPHQTARFDPGMLPAVGSEVPGQAPPAEPVNPHQTARFDPGMLPTAGEGGVPQAPVSGLGAEPSPTANPHQTARFDPVAMGVVSPPGTEPPATPAPVVAPLETPSAAAPSSTEFVPPPTPEPTPLGSDPAPMAPEVAPVFPESAPPVAEFTAPASAPEVPLISPTGIGTEEADVSSLEASASFASVAASLDGPGSQAAFDPPSFEPAPSAVDPSSFATPSFDAPAQDLPTFEAPAVESSPSSASEAASFDAPSFDAPAQELPSFEAPSSFDPPSFEAPSSFESPSFDPPVAEAPAFDPPAATSFDPPPTEAPAFAPAPAEAPSFEAPSSFDPPSFDPPVAEPPSFESPSFEAPSFESPSSFAPAPSPTPEPSAVEPPAVQAPSPPPAAEEGFGFEAPFAGSSLGEAFADPTMAGSGQRSAGNPPLDVPVPSSAVGDIRDLAASEGSDDLGFGGDMLSSLEGFDTTLGPDAKLPESMQRAQEQMAQLRQEEVETAAPANPYVPAGATNGLTPGSFVLRAAAFVVDSIWAGGLVFGFMGLSELITAQLGPQMGRLAVTAIPVFLSLLVVLVGWSVWGSTPGKRLCGLVVTDAEGKAGIGFPRAVVRLVGYVVSTMLLGLGFLMALGASRRALHDVLAGSQVLKR